MKLFSFKGFSRNVFALGSVSFLTDVASEMIYPLLPLFLVSTIGAGAATVGAIEGAAESTAAVLKLVSGWWSDRLRRRKPLVVAGYALAAGGPVLHPHAMEMVLLPIMPHLTASFRLVLRPDSEVKLKLKTMHTATLSIDGHTNIPVENDTVVTVKRSSHTLKFLRIHPRDSFYATLEQRLKGKH